MTKQELTALRLTPHMREMLLHPVDKTFGGDLVVAYTPTRSRHALQYRGLIDNSCRLTEKGRAARALLQEQENAHVKNLMRLLQEFCG